MTGATNTLVDITDQLKTRKELQQAAGMKVSMVSKRRAVSRIREEQA